MADKKLDDIEQRKKQLEAELQEIQQELDTSFDEVRLDVTSRLKPRNLIKKYPLQSVGISALLGFLIGKKPSSSKNSSKSSESLSTVVLKELKGMATKKAVNFLFDYLDSVIDEKKDEIINENGQDA